MDTETALESKGLSVWEETKALIMKVGLRRSVARTKAKVNDETVGECSVRSQSDGLVPTGLRGRGQRSVHTREAKGTGFGLFSSCPSYNRLSKLCSFVSIYLLTRPNLYHSIYVAYKI